MTDRHQLVAWIRTYVADLLELPAEDVDPHTSFTDLGLSSIQAAQLTGDLSSHLDADVAPTAIYDHATIDRLANSLAGG